MEFWPWLILRKHENSSLTKSIVYIEMKQSVTASNFSVTHIQSKTRQFKIVVKLLARFNTRKFLTAIKVLDDKSRKILGT